MGRKILEEIMFSQTGQKKKLYIWDAQEAPSIINIKKVLPRYLGIKPVKARDKEKFLNTHKK